MTTGEQHEEESVDRRRRSYDGRRSRATVAATCRDCDAIESSCWQRLDDVSTMRRGMFQRLINDVVMLVVISQATLMLRCAAAAAGELKLVDMGT